jgi:hypothetical protein
MALTGYSRQLFSRALLLDQGLGRDRSGSVTLTLGSVLNSGRKSTGVFNAD